MVSKKENSMLALSKKMSRVKVFLIILFATMYGGHLVAQGFQQQPQQQNYSEKQVNAFVNAVVEVLPLQQKIEQKMIKKIEDNGMSLEKYNQIAQSVQTTGNADGVSDDDMQKFRETSTKVQAIQEENQDEINQKITDAGLEPMVYQDMVQEYSRNPQFQQKVDEKLRKKQQK